nr:hypothetical protein [Tanacetum cinerariifolium]
MLQMCPKLPGQKFLYPPFEEDILTFMRELGYSGNMKFLSDVKVDTLPQPWRTFGTLISKCLSGKHEVVQKYSSILPDYLTIQSMKESEAYKTYHDLATGKVQLKQYMYVDLPEVALTDAEQLKLATKRSLIQTHSSYASGSGAHKRTSVKPSVPDVPIYHSDEEEISWKSSDEEDNDGDDFVHPKFSTHNDEARKEKEEILHKLNLPDHIDPHGFAGYLKMEVKTITPTDRVRDSPVITPFHDDPDILVRHAYTPVATDTESEPFEDPIEIDETRPLSPRTTPLSPDYTLTFPGYTLDTPHSNEESDPIEASETRIASPSDSTSPLSPNHPLTQTSPTHIPSKAFYYPSTARKAMRTQLILSPGIFARVTKAASLSPSSFRKRYRSSYETPSSSPSPTSSSTLLIRKRYRGTSEPILDTKTEDDESEAKGAGSESEKSEDEVSLTIPSPVSSLVTTPAATIVVEEDEFIELILSPGIFARVTEVASLSPSSFRKRYRSSYETPSSSPSPTSSSTLPIRKRYRGTSELILDTETEDDELEAKGAGSESEKSEDEGLGSEGEEAAYEQQQQAVLIEDTTADEPLGLGYRAARLSLTIPSPVSSLVTTPAATIVVAKDEFIEARYKDQREIQALRMQHAVDQYEMQGLKERVATLERKMDCFER